MDAPEVKKILDKFPLDDSPLAESKFQETVRLTAGTQTDLFGERLIFDLAKEESVDSLRSRNFMFFFNFF